MVVLDYGRLQTPLLNITDENEEIKPVRESS